MIFIDSNAFKVIIKYWLYSLCCTLHPVSNLFTHFIFYLLIPYPYFATPPHFSPLLIISLFSIFVNLFLCCISRLLYFLDSTYMWRNTVFVFVWLTSLTIMSYRSLNVVAKGKLSFFFYGWLIFYLLYTHTQTHTAPTFALSFHLLIDI